jgi:adenylate kinase
LYQRDDDKEETVRKRIVVYETSTAPVIDFYKKRGVAITVDGMVSIEEVNECIKKALAEC